MVVALVHAVPLSVSAVQVSNTVEPRRFSIRDGQVLHMLVVIVVWLVVERVTAVHPTDSKSPSPANLSEQKTIHSRIAVVQTPIIVVAVPSLWYQLRLQLLPSVNVDWLDVQLVLAALNTASEYFDQIRPMRTASVSSLI